jgi:ABC-2 type transport system permease protein
MSVAAFTPDRVPRFRDTLAAECVKIASLRAVVPLLALASAIAVGGALLSAEVARGGDAEPVATALSAMPYANVIVAALAVTLTAGEYTSGMMRLSLTVTPRRRRLLGAKLAAVGGLGLLSGVVSATLALAVGLQLLSSHGVAVPALGDPEALRAIAGAGAGGALVAILGTCLAVAIRRVAPANAVTNLIAFLPGILVALPEFWQRHLIAFLPTGAAAALSGGVPGASHTATLSAPVAWAVVAAWAVVLSVVAGMVLERRDA